MALPPAGWSVEQGACLPLWRKWGAGLAAGCIPTLDGQVLMGLSEPRLVLPEMSGEIRSCLMELESCFRLLVPFDLDPTPGAALPPMAEEGGRDEEQPCCSKTLAICARRPGAAGAEGPPLEDKDEDSDPEGFVRHHGLGSREYTLEVELSSGTRCAHARPPCPRPRALPRAWASRGVGSGVTQARGSCGPRPAALIATRRPGREGGPDAPVMGRPGGSDSGWEKEVIEKQLSPRL